MHKRAFVLLAASVLAAAICGLSFAADAPSFGISTAGTKLGDVKGDTWHNGLHGLIVYGSDVYAMRIGGHFSESEVLMDYSNDLGQTWLSSSGIAKGAAPYGGGIAIAPNTKTAHFVWDAQEPLQSPGNNTYYGNGSTTTRVNGPINVSLGASVIAADGKGGIHVVLAGTETNTIYHAFSTDSGLTFSTPAVVVSNATDSFSLAADSAGNLYLAYKTPDTAVSLMKKKAGGPWAGPNTVCTNCMDNDPSMAVYDSQRIYIAVGPVIFSTANGGKSWAQSAGSPASGYENSLAVDSGGRLNFAWEESDGIHFARTDLSHDPSRWGLAVLALPGGNLPNLAVDSNGKAYIMGRKQIGGGSTAVFTKEK